MFKAIIFDLDGVITDTAVFHFEAWQQLADTLAISLTEEFNESLKGVDRSESLRRILALDHQEENYTDAEKDQFAAEKNELYVRSIEKMTAADILPGIQVFLDELRKQGIKIGLASASRNAPQILMNLGLQNRFDCIVDPATLKKGKPDPEIFEAACHQLDILPSEAIGIEDAYSGIQAINAAQIFSVGIGDAVTLKEANIILPSTKELTYEKLKTVWENKESYA